MMAEAGLVQAIIFNDEVYYNKQTSDTLIIQLKDAEKIIFTEPNTHKCYHCSPTGLDELTASGILVKTRYLRHLFTVAPNGQHSSLHYLATTDLRDITLRLLLATGKPVRNSILDCQLIMDPEKHTLILKEMVTSKRLQYFPDGDGFSASPIDIGNLFQSIKDTVKEINNNKKKL